MSYRITADELAELQRESPARRQSPCRVSGEDRDVLRSGRDAEGFAEVPPTLSEPVLQNLPPPPTDPQEFGKWAQSLSELAEQRAELRWQEGNPNRRRTGKGGRASGGNPDWRGTSLLLVLRSRGFDIPKALEQRIAGGTDPVLFRLVAGAVQQRSRCIRVVRWVILSRCDYTVCCFDC